MGNTTCTRCMLDSDDINSSKHSSVTMNNKTHNTNVLQNIHKQNSTSAKPRMNPISSYPNTSPVPRTHPTRATAISIHIQDDPNNADITILPNCMLSSTPPAQPHTIQLHQSTDTTHPVNNPQNSSSSADTALVSALNGKLDMMSLMVAQSRTTAENGTDKQSEVKRAALCRAADEILPFLYLGGYHNVWAEPGAARSNKNAELMKLGITHILTIAEECSVLWPLEFYYMKIPIFDVPSENIAKYFQQCIDFIDRARYEDGKVLVHCWVGVSRSASIVIAYLMARCDMRLHEAYDHVKSRRNIICPNKSFIKALQQLDKDLYPDFLTGQYA